MENRRTDNLPVTDASLARVRDEIAGAFSHPSPDTITLDTDQSAMLHRTIQNLTQREADLRSQLDEAVVLLRSSAWRLACESRNDLAVKNDRLQARNIESFLSRHDGSKVAR